MMISSITDKYGAVKMDDYYMDPSVKDLLNMFIHDIHRLNLIIHGKSGSGKTSVLNTVIRDYYGSNFGRTTREDNVLYINNSKDQGINYFRTDVKTFCQTPCTIRSKNKIIAIDDIDNLNEQSQQVFRTYIDNYSHNVFFVFTCTNLQKIIESLQSRQTIVKLSNVTHEKLRRICDNVIVGEGMRVSREAQAFLISISNTSIHVLFNYLEKFILMGHPIEYADAVRLCTNINFDDFRRYMEYVSARRLGDAIGVLVSLYDDGYSVMDILDSLFVFIKITDTIGEPVKYDIVSYICKYIHVFHDIHEDEIELAFFTNNIMRIFGTRATDSQQLVG